MSDEGTSVGWDSHVHVFDEAAPVVPGHYRPVRHTLAEIESLAIAHGVGHLVLVQPSVYGSDNTVLIQALAVQPGRHRGVVVLNGSESDDWLETAHAAGVRGARLNLVSPVGEVTTGFERRFHALAPRLRERGWHVEWYALPERLERISALHVHGAPTAVLDHLAGLHAGLRGDDPAWTAVQVLADAGAWVKLSGWYRLGATLPYDALLAHVQRLRALFGERLIWGSDWPHTSFAAGAAPGYGATFAPVVSALGARAAATLRIAAAPIYR